MIYFAKINLSKYPNLSKHMKLPLEKTALLSLILISATLLFSCKKGENDPFLSLRSRKSRIVGEWKLQKGFEKSAFSYNTSVQYNETSGSKTDENGTINFTYSMEYTFKKDGSYTYSYTETPTGDKTTTRKNEGRWTFLAKNNSGKFKNKERILLTETLYSYTYDGNTSTNIESTPTDGTIFYLDQLENKKMIIKFVSENKNENAGVSANETSELEYTFISK
jgi:hypothetical protein